MPGGRGRFVVHAWLQSAATWVLPPASRRLLSKGMSGLSNFFKSRDPTPRDVVTAVVRQVGPGEIEPGVRLLLGSNGQLSAPAIAAEFEHVAAHRAVDLTAMRVADLHGRLIAAALAVPTPGGTALLMLSTAGASQPVAMCIGRCAEASVAALSVDQPLLVQTLLEINEPYTAEALGTVGFEDLATLIYLQRQCERPMPAPGRPEGIAEVHYSTDTHAGFCEAILASYEQSLDCPPLHGRRNIEDVIAGHMATGDFDPKLWTLLLEKDKPIALLLLSRVSGHSTMELVYLGLATAARGRKIGDYLLKRALHETHAAGLRQLTLAVDANNAPALRLYHRHGLAEIHRRFAMMRTLP